MKYPFHFIGGLAAAFAGPGIVYAAETLLAATPATQGFAYIVGGTMFALGAMTVFIASGGET